MSQVRNRVADALALVVKDTHGTYDECFVDRLLDDKVHLKENGEVCDRLLELYEHAKTNDFDKIKLARLFKIHRALVRANSSDARFLRRLTNLLLDVLPDVLIRKNSSEIASALNLLLDLSSNDDDFKDMEVKQFDRFNPENDSQSSVTNVLDLAGYYILRSANYQIQETAQNLYVSMVSKMTQHSENSVLIDNLKTQLEDMLIDVKTPIVYCLMCRLLDNVSILTSTSLFHYIQCLLRQAFNHALESKSHQDLNRLAKCLAKANIPSGEILSALTKVDDLESIISFVTAIDSFSCDTMFSYIIYPLLLRCDNDDSKMLAGTLAITQEEKSFIERHLNEKVVHQCLSYLRSAILKDYPFRTSSGYIVTSEKLHFSIETVFQYLICNYKNPSAHKNLIDCCYILRESHVSLTEPIFLVYMVRLLTDLIHRDKIDKSPHLKLVAMQVLQILSSMYQVSNMNTRNDQDFKDYWNTIVDVALECNDPEVLYEFANFFRLASIPMWVHMSEYADLILEHMLPIARKNDHRELLALSAILLIKIDLELSMSQLESRGIRRHHDIPALIGKTLLDYSSVYSVVEIIIEGLINPATLDESTGHHWSRVTINYMEWLDSRTLPRTVQNCLDQLVKGVCAAIKGECSVDLKRKALCEIITLINTFLINDDSPDVLLIRLVKTDILEMLYTVGTCPLYPGCLRLVAVQELPRIKRFILDKLGTADEVTAKLSNALKKQSNSLSGHEERAKNIVQLYMSEIENKSPGKFEQETDADKLGLESFLNDILDYPRIDWGPSECY